MGRLSASLIALVLGAAVAVALVSCGSGSSADLLPGATASQINSNLDQVRQLVGEGECIGAQDAAGEISVQIDELSGVDKKLKEALSEGAERLNEVVANCEEPEEEAEGLEGTEETETTEKKQKPEKPEKEKSKLEKETKEPPVKPTEPPTQEEGGESPSGEVEPPSGGVGPGSPAGEE